MIVVDSSVTIKWFVTDDPLVEEAALVLAKIGREPSPYATPDLFMNELLAVLCLLPGSQASKVQEALSLVEALGMALVGNGHELLGFAADFAGQWKVPGYDAVYVVRAAGRIRRPSLVQVLGP